MNTTTLILLLILLASFAHFIGRKRSLAVSNNNRGKNKLHSLPGYYGYLMAIWCIIPALVVLLAWTTLGDMMINRHIATTLQTESTTTTEVNLIMNQVRNLAEAGKPEAAKEPAVQQAVQQYIRMQQTTAMAKAVVVLAVALIGAFIGWRFIAPHVRARNQVESVMRWGTE